MIQNTYTLKIDYDLDKIVVLLNDKIVVIKMDITLDNYCELYQMISAQSNIL